MAADNARQIIGFVNNLLVTPAIEKAAARSGYRLTWVENATDIPLTAIKSENPDGGGRAAPGSGLLQMLSQTQPALMIFDLDNPEIPWKDWLAWLTSLPETRRIPVICFGPHVNTEDFKLARSLGAAAVFARSRFLADLPAHIQKYARTVMVEQIQIACEGPVSELAQMGIELFNQGKYFEAHEELELAWKADNSEARELYRGILQVGIAYLQIERGNYRGAVKMLLRVRQWLEPLPAVCRGVSVSHLRQDAEKVYAELVHLGEAKVSDFNRDLFGKVITV